MEKTKDQHIQQQEQELANQETGLSLEEQNLKKVNRFKDLLDRNNCSSCGMPLSVGMDGRKVCFICRF